ncbi:DegT/DnrJ/EryC1/StrS family aminotransferase [Shimia sp. R11_0]|uniref:DegT/DnrJ/EryC1/StrS family aminotransferase n=1 Tax=Shimia sp. R11_0 TaxID=2821096 RepID=UPI001ADD538B|nr:DegT/DnrJ/EryC1/StrS family aminotransferase [Shimia sp. R11_0]MBO9477944.1 DegT/DnrJ/EryC1/StrS family aminotransferase [Shimia sp. R11_0]
MSAAGGHSQIPVMRPQLPATADLMPFLQEIDRNRYYSNHGPLYRSFLRELDQTANFPVSSSILVGNATQGLTSVLRVKGLAGRPYCALPAWSFVASAAAVVEAGMQPYFVDVEEDTWAYSPLALRDMPLDKLAAVMVVAPFGQSVPLQEWDEWSSLTGIPVIIDAAAGFDFVIQELEAYPNLTTVVSLHATKTLSSGEGGWLIDFNKDVLRDALADGNFGYLDGAIGQTFGHNYKMSEYHAAVGLASLKTWDMTRRRFAERFNKMVEALEPLPLSVFPNPSKPSFISSTFHITTEVPADFLASELLKRGVLTRQWWGEGIHRLKAYTHFPRGDLSTTNKIAPYVLGLPFSVDMTDGEIARVRDAIAEAFYVHAMT